MRLPWNSLRHTARMAIVIIDKTVEITRPAVGIGVETVPISRDSNCTESIIVRFLRNPLAPTVDARRSLIWAWR
jgi:hypothetical protein